MYTKYDIYVFIQRVLNSTLVVIGKGNNTIIELQTIFQREIQNSLNNKQKNSVNNWETGQPEWPWLGTGISKEMMEWIRFYGANISLPLRFKGSGCHYNGIYNNTGKNR